MNISELLSEWLQNACLGRIKAQTDTRYRSLIELHILPALGTEEIGCIGKRQISDFLAEMNQNGNIRSGGGLSAVSINLMLSILNMAFEYACDREYIQSNPCINVKRVPSVQTRRADAFTKEEQRRIEQVIQEEGDERAFGILLSFYTGLRIGELLGLEWGDVDEDFSLIRVSKTVYRGKDGRGGWHLCVDTPKSASSERTIPLPEHISSMLAAAYKRRSGSFVVTNKKGERMPTRSYQYIFQKITERAGVRKLSFHAIRHTFATRALECGMDIKTLSEIMGHKDASVTLGRYAHSMLETKRLMMLRMTKV